MKKKKDDLGSTVGLPKEAGSFLHNNVVFQKCAYKFSYLELSRNFPIIYLINGVIIDIRETAHI